MATLQAHRRKTITIMKKLNVYKPEFSPLIDIYAGLRSQYDTLMEKWEQQGFDPEVETMQGGTKKAPIVATLETLRKDILAYSDRLCLNPKALDTVDIVIPKKSKLDEAMSKLLEDPLDG